MERWRKRLEQEIERQGRSMKEVSLAAGLGETYVRDAIRRGRGKFENLGKIASVLGKTPVWFLDLAETGLGEGGPESNISVQSRATSSRRNTVPIYGHAVAGTDGRFLLNGTVIGTIGWPVQSESSPQMYAVIVSGDSMFPRYRSGELCLVDPARQVRKTDDVVVQISASSDAEAPDGFVKEFVSLSEARLTLRQHNPSRTITLPRSSVLTIHRVIGSLS